MNSLKSLPKGGQIIGIIAVVMLILGLIAYNLKITLPGTPPSLYNTFTPLSKATPQEIGSYDVLGRMVTKEEAEEILQTPAGQAELSPEKGAVKITEDLINLGRETFYLNVARRPSTPLTGRGV